MKFSLKNLQNNPAALITIVIVLMAGSFYAGNAFQTRLTLPGIAATNKADFSSLNALYGVMQRNFDGKIDNAKAVEGAKAGLIAAGGDPYTVYMTAKEAKTLSDDLSGKLSGIGAEIGIRNNILTIVAPIDNAPAAKAGLRPGDLIARINGEDTTGMSVDTAVSKIRGAKDTKVTLKLVRSGVQEAFDVTITRAEITVPSVKWSIKNGNVGYIDISRFGPDTTDLMDQAAGELKTQGATKIILDLRNNPGGYLNAGVTVASQFLASETVVVEERTNGKTTTTLKSSGSARLQSLPTIVLINSGSASASEIVAGALHDHKIARLLGEKSFGKGSVQEIKDLADGAQLKVTIAHWYTPKGININKEGIKPDIEVKLSADDYNANRDPQLDKALELLK